MLRLPARVFAAERAAPIGDRLFDRRITSAPLLSIQGFVNRIAQTPDILTVIFQANRHDIHVEGETAVAWGDDHDGPTEGEGDAKLVAHRGQLGRLGAGQIEDRHVAATKAIPSLLGVVPLGAGRHQLEPARGARLGGDLLDAGAAGEEDRIHILRDRRRGPDRIGQGEVMAHAVVARVEGELAKRFTLQCDDRVVSSPELVQARPGPSRAYKQLLDGLMLLLGFVRSAALDEQESLDATEEAFHPLGPRAAGQRFTLMRRSIHSRRHAAHQLPYLRHSAHHASDVVRLLLDDLPQLFEDRRQRLSALRRECSGPNLFVEKLEQHLVAGRQLTRVGRGSRVLQLHRLGPQRICFGARFFVVRR